MLNILSKLISDSDIKRAHKAAVSVEQARVSSCVDHFGECDLYGKTLANYIKYSKDGRLSSSEKSELRDQLNQLKSTIKSGKIQLANILKNKTS